MDFEVELDSGMGLKEGETFNTAVTAGAANRDGAVIGSLEIGVRPANAEQALIAELQEEVAVLRARTAELEAQLADLHLYMQND